MPDEPYQPTDNNDSSPQENIRSCAMCGALISIDEYECEKCGEPQRGPILDYHRRRMWKNRQCLVIKFEASLPDRCLKTNAPSCGNKYKQTFYWTSIAFIFAQFVVILLPIMFCFISRFLSMVFLLFGIYIATKIQRSASFEIGITSELLHRIEQKNRFWKIVTVLSLIVTIVLPFIVPSQELKDLTFGIGFLATFSFWMTGRYASQFMKKKGVSGRYIWLEGVHPDILAELPLWKHKSPFQ